MHCTFVQDAKEQTTLSGHDYLRTKYLAWLCFMPQRSASAGAVRDPLQAVVCARHGHDFMGCKSPVPYLERGHIDNFKSTSRKQGVGG